MAVPSRVRLVVLLVLAVLVSSSAYAQTGVPLSGRLVNSLTGEPLGAATVEIEELRRETISAADGTFSFDDVPPGSYHIFVRAQGYSTRRTEVQAAPGAAAIELQVDFDLHFEEVVTVGPEARSQFESVQPVAVLSGQELTKQLGASLGATLEQQPGMATRSLGPAPARPVIRGLDGDRVLILQDGQRLGDLSSQSGDHGVTVNPAAATSIEVVRGPATLLYGANAIGGIVNVITDEIPTRPQIGVGGNVTFDVGTAANEGGAAGDIHAGNGTVALHLGGGGRRSGDVATPRGEIANSHSRGGFGSVGLSWTGERGYLGGSYGYDDTKYGVPVVEDGTIQLTPRRHALTVRGEARALPGAFDRFTATLAHRRYEHQELEGEEVGTVFTNRTTEVELRGSHRALGHVKGSVGGWLLDRSFGAAGAEALSPPVDQHGFAAFIYEEITWPHATIQLGGRVDRTGFEPAGEGRRDYTNASGSVGLLLRPAAADDNITVAISLARAARNPALEELFFFGQHQGNFALEVGNPDLASERARGFDASVRWRGSRVSGELTYFRNSVDDFIYRRDLTPEEFEAREAAFVARFGGREPAGHGHGDEGLAIIEYVGADAVLQGVETHVDVQLTPRLTAEAALDYVRGTLSDGDEPLPRMPPLRGRAGLRYQVNAFQVGGDLVATRSQQRVARRESRTEGYGLVRLFGSYSFAQGATINTVTVRLDNATDTLYRNHLSLIKDLVPEMGRNFKVLYNLQF